MLNVGNFREWSTTTIKINPSNPQQPIHSLLSNSKSWRDDKWEQMGWWTICSSSSSWKLMKHMVDWWMIHICVHQSCLIKQKDSRLGPIYSRWKIVEKWTWYGKLEMTWTWYTGSFTHEKSCSMDMHGNLHKLLLVNKDIPPHMAHMG